MIILPVWKRRWDAVGTPVTFGGVRTRTGGDPSTPPRSVERPEARSQFLSENCRLLPRGKVAALFSAVVIDQLRVSSFGPAPRGLILFAGEDGHCHRNGDTLGVE